MPGGGAVLLRLALWAGHAGPTHPFFPPPGATSPGFMIHLKGHHSRLAGDPIAFPSSTMKDTYS